MKNEKSYTVRFTAQSLKHLKKIANEDVDTILNWINKNLIDTTNPRFLGKALSGHYSNYWRYRVGKYRIIADIKDQEIVIEVIAIGHRKSIYR